MKRLERTKMGGGLTAAAISASIARAMGPLLSLALASNVTAQCQYSVTVLPEIQCTFWIDRPPPAAINNLGHVAAYSDCGGGRRPVLWTGGDQWTFLPLPPGFDEGQPHALNDLDEVVGEAVDTVALPGGGTLSTTYACLWRPGQPPQLLGIPAGGNYSIVTGVNNHSEICGYWGHTVTGPIRAFMWHDGTMTTLAVPFLDAALAEDINEHSQIAGWGFNGLESRCFRWSEGVAYPLPTLPGAVGSRANAIADDGRVVGRSVSSSRKQVSDSHRDRMVA